MSLLVDVRLPTPPRSSEIEWKDEEQERVDSEHQQMQPIDGRIPLIPPSTLHLKQPTVRFTIPTAYSPYTDLSSTLQSAVEIFSLEQSLTMSQRKHVTDQVCQVYCHGVREERLKQGYFELLVKEHGGGKDSTAGVSRSNDSIGISDSILLYDEDEIETGMEGLHNGEGGREENSNIHSQLIRKSGLDAWVAAASSAVAVSSAGTPSTSSPSVSSTNTGASTLDEPKQSLATLITRLLASTREQTPAGTMAGTNATALDESPLAKLYRFCCVKHTEHLIHRQQSELEFHKLREKQSREMDTIFLQAQPSEIEKALHGTGMKRDETENPYLNPGAMERSSSSNNPTTELDLAISSLVQSHLHETRTLEDSFAYDHLLWVRSQKHQMRVYLENLSQEQEDLSHRRMEYDALRKHEARKRAREMVEAAGKKIVQSEEEEREFAQKEREAELLAESITPTDGNVNNPSNELSKLLRPFRTERQMERETIVPRDFAFEPTLAQTQTNGDTSTISSTIQSASSSASTADTTAAGKKSTKPPLSASNSSKSLLGTSTTSSTSVPSLSASEIPSSTPILSLPPLTPPFPLHSVLASKVIQLGSPPEPAHSLEVFLTNDPLFVSSGEKVGATATIPSNNKDKDPAASSSSAATTTPTPAALAASLASLPVSSSPLVSFSHFISALDGAYGSVGEGGLRAMILPHHTSPLEHAVEDLAERLCNSTTSDGSTSTTPSDTDLTPEQFLLVRSQRESSLHQFNNANSYVKNWLHYARGQTDLFCDEFGVQMQRVKDALEHEQASIKNSTGATSAVEEGSATTSSSTSTASSNVTPLLSHGDFLVSSHCHSLNSQLCFHLNLHPRRGGRESGSIGASIEMNTIPTGTTDGSGGVRMNLEEMEQQTYLFTEIIPKLIDLCVRYNIRTLSLPLIWDNILLSMWTISGSYVGFGWKETSPTDGTSPDVSSVASSNRAEEMAVYECMVRYLESHLRVLKQCIAQIKKNSPLREVVIYLPSTQIQTKDIEQRDPNNSSMTHEIGVGVVGLSISSSHPFLPKCRTIFREVFQ